MTIKSLENNHRLANNRLNNFKYPLLAIFFLLVIFLGFILFSGFRANNRVSPAYAFARQTQTALEIDPTPTPFRPDDVAFVSELANEPNSSTEKLSTKQTELDQKAYQKPEGQVNILLLGSDMREDDYGFRTDSITWVSLNPKGGFVSAISFPRDLFVFIPGYGENRINTAFGWGGFDLLADTLDINFGVRPDKYVLVDMRGFTSVVDNLGGIYVQAEENLTDSCASWISASGECSVGPGLVHLDGDTALWYARSRYSTSDIDRARRAQEVILGIFKRLMSLDAVLKAPDLYKAYSSNVETDVDLPTVLSMLPLAKSIYDNGDVRKFVIGFDEAYDWITYTGAYVLVPDKEAIHNILFNALELH